jgi:hypothetical protein
MKLKERIPIASPSSKSSTTVVATLITSDCFASLRFCFAIFFLLVVAFFLYPGFMLDAAKAQCEQLQRSWHTTECRELVDRTRWYEHKQWRQNSVDYILPVGYVRTSHEVQYDSTKLPPEASNSVQKASSNRIKQCIHSQHMRYCSGNCTN